MEKNNSIENSPIVPINSHLKAQENRLESKVSIDNGKFIKEKMNKLKLFYNENEIILDKYAHLKTPQHILDDIRNVLHSKKKKLETGYGITFEISYSNSSIDFLKDSIKYAIEEGKPAVHQSLMAYWTTFNQLDKKQKEWYFYWRNQVLHRNYLNTDLSYLILFTYELINYSFNQNAAFNVSMMVRLLEAYKERNSKVEHYLRSWIHDFLIELDEKELAKEWDSTTVRTNSLYDRLLEKSVSLETISITLWKQYINGYRETEFFRANKSKIYKIFKESIPLLREAFEEQGISYMERWFKEVKGTQSNYLFGSAVIGRNISQREYFIETVEIRPTQELYDDVTTLFRLAENVTRIVKGEKRQLKVNEEKLPEGLKERMVDRFSKISASKTRFKKVQDRSSQSEGSKIPQPETENTPQKAFVLDFERIQQLQQESKELQQLFEES
ncbi:TerB N-terminal domain-containing protein, partial [Brevibacillus borstelensis]|uniref:TerB N-terminal domain-containing protein n=1 Tax=Brevibacillus borstelensis TaxID=45462 RepID=UPI0030BD6585